MGSNIWDLVLWEVSALFIMFLLKLTVDSLRKRYCLSKAYGVITKRLDGGAADFTAFIGGTYAELPIKITLVSFLNKYVDYLTENNKGEYVAIVGGWRQKAVQYSKVSNVPYNIVHLLSRVEQAVEAGKTEGANEWLQAIMIAISEREKLYSINKKLNTISIILGAIGVIGVIATFYFGINDVQ